MFFRTVGAINLLYSRPSVVGAAVLRGARAAVCSGEGRLGVVRLHQSGRQSAHSVPAEHVHGHKTCNESVAGGSVSDLVDGVVGHVEHLFLLPGVSRDGHGGLTGERVGYFPALRRARIYRYVVDIKLGHRKPVLLPEGEQTRLDVFGQGIQMSRYAFEPDVSTGHELYDRAFGFRGEFAVSHRQHIRFRKDLFGSHGLEEEFFRIGDLQSVLSFSLQREHRAIVGVVNGHAPHRPTQICGI